jgi:hypothetical protein
MLVWVALDGSVPPTGQSGDRPAVLAALGISRAPSVIIPRTVRAERQTVWCEDGQQLLATSAAANCQMVHGTVWCPPKTESNQLEYVDHCIVQCPVCTGQSDAPRTEGNQGLPNGAPIAPRSLGL